MSLGKALELDCGERRIAALQWGDPDGAPVLALHGWMDHAGSFAELAPLLDGCRTVAIDWPGHGRSPLDPGGDHFHFVDNVVVIDQALAALGWSRAHLLGHSMGAALALLYAAAYPDRAASLISIDMLGPISDEPGDFPTRLRRALQARSDYAERRRHFDTREAAIAARVKPELSSQGATLLAERGLEQTPDGWTWCGDRRLKLPSLTRLTSDQIDAALRATDVPTLVIRAAGDRPQRLEKMFARRFKELPRGTLATLPGGHHLHLENPGPCAATIVEFLLGPGAAEES